MFYLDHQLDDLRQDDSCVSLSFSNGKTVQAKVLIGCDGNQSVVREKILEDGPPQYAGQGVWRGYVQIQDWPYTDQYVTRAQSIWQTK